MNKARRPGNACRCVHASRSSRKKFESFTLPGFQIARDATDRADLQLRMQGNAFLGAFFAVSPILQEFGITPEQFREVVRKQYVKKFGRLGDAVVKSNMEVMTQGFEKVREIRIGELEAPDRSSLRGAALLPVLGCDTDGDGCSHSCQSVPVPAGQPERTPLARIATFDAEFRSGLGYDQPASPLASVGVVAAASGATASKYVARRETPLFIAENCTQCMECIAVCPDTALPNCSQDLSTLLSTAVSFYVKDPAERQKMLHSLPEIEKRTRRSMMESVTNKTLTPLPQILRNVTNEVDGISDEAKCQFFDDHRKDSDGLSEGDRYFRFAGKKKSGKRRSVFNLRFGPLQGMRRVRHGLWRSPGSSDGAGDGRSQRRARNGDCFS